uniref:Large ribosomal subunit protein bL21c n=1 Tax=Yamadaella caenomyce TaxID=259029 RepID=A0A1G4NYE8_9FLOR|nr:Ribosomal protein L21 [Yamadaella caenomyce]SCW23710.1 Ribosomal protein L21 [Yamadaella caenomyce]
MIYAIIEASGRQLWVTPGKFYDINKISAQPGDYIQFQRVLFLKNKEKVLIGYPHITNLYAKAKVLRHFQGRKVTVFKMKPKKNMYTKNGHRQKLSRILIESIQETR